MVGGTPPEAFPGLLTACIASAFYFLLWPANCRTSELRRRRCALDLPPFFNPGDGLFLLFLLPIASKPIFKPSEFNTLIIVSNLGFASGLKALYKLSRPNPESDAIFAIPLAFAMSPIAANNNLRSFSSTIALKYAAIDSSSFKYSDTSKFVILSAILTSQFRKYLSSNCDISLLR